MQVLFWIVTIALYVCGAVTGLAFISYFDLMRLPRPVDLHSNYHLEVRRRRRIWVKSQLAVAMIYISLMGFIWDPALVAKYQKVELSIMIAMMLLTAGFLQAVAWAAMRWFIERPRSGAPRVLRNP